VISQPIIASIYNAPGYLRFRSFHAPHHAPQLFLLDYKDPVCFKIQVVSNNEDSSFDLLSDVLSDDASCVVSYTCTWQALLSVKESKDYPKMMNSITICSAVDKEIQQFQIVTLLVRQRRFHFIKLAKGPAYSSIKHTYAPSTCLHSGA
jgi:hypothetical protein